MIKNDSRRLLRIKRQKAFLEQLRKGIILSGGDIDRAVKIISNRDFLSNKITIHLDEQGRPNISLATNSNISSNVRTQKTIKCSAARNTRKVTLNINEVNQIISYVKGVARLTESKIIAKTDDPGPRKSW